MLRALLIYLSESRSLRAVAERSSLGQRVSARFVAGATACFLAGLMLVNSSCSSRDHHDDLDPHIRRGGGPEFRPINGPSLQSDGTLQGGATFAAAASMSGSSVSGSSAVSIAVPQAAPEQPVTSHDAG